jgi:hypothetical protein
LIAYGVAAFTWFFSRTLPAEEEASTAASMLPLIGFGLLLQLLVLMLRKRVERYERQHGLENQIAPLVMYVVEILLDGVTVLLFALATFSSISRFPAGL